VPRTSTQRLNPRSLSQKRVRVASRRGHSLIRRKGFARPCRTCPPKTEPSRSAPHAIRGSAAVTRAAVSPPREWPRTPTPSTWRPSKPPSAVQSPNRRQRIPQVRDPGVDDRGEPPGRKAARVPGERAPDHPPSRELHRSGLVRVVERRHHEAATRKILEEPGVHQSRDAVTRREDKHRIGSARHTHGSARIRMGLERLQKAGRDVLLFRDHASDAVGHVAEPPAAAARSRIRELEHHFTASSTGNKGVTSSLDQPDGLGPDDVPPGGRRRFQDRFLRLAGSRAPAAGGAHRGQCHRGDP
jgi:hypothetical protein